MSQPTARSGPSHHLRISRGSTKLVILFSGVGAHPGNFQYWKVGKALRAHCLFVNDVRRHWYQSGVAGLGDDAETTLASIRAWARELGVDEIYTFGQSMGAYGAVLYGARLGARVAAFGAETVLGLEASRSAALMPVDAPAHCPDLAPTIMAARRPILCFAGEQDAVDLYCMSRTYAFPNFQPRTLVALGHDIAAHLHQRDRLVPLLRAFVDNQPIPPLEEEGSALANPGFAEAFYNLHRHSKAGRHAEAADAGTLAVACFRRSDRALFLTARALFALERFAEALPLLQRAVNIAPANIDYRFLTGRTLARMGKRDRAIALFEAIVADQPDFASAFYHLAAASHRRGNDLRALEAVRRAIALRPDLPASAALRDKIEAKLGPDAILPQPPGLASVVDLYRSLRDTVTRR